MSAPCESLDAFVAGALGEREAVAFEAHLGGCAACQSRLHEAIQLDLVFQEAAARDQKVVSRPHRFFRRERVALLVLAASVLFVLGAARVLRSRAPAEEPVSLALGPSRTLEARLTHALAEAHRPYVVDRALGQRQPEAIPARALALLEARADVHGLATAYLLQGATARAEALLTTAGTSVALESDRAVIAMERGAWNDALGLFEGVLAVEPEHPQAAWNRALVLGELGLPLLAARSFDAVAARGEPGWADEARQRAAALRRDEDTRQRDWKEAYRLGREMVKGGAPLPPSLARAHPGVSRLLLYDAVRAADSAARVRGLLPLAAELDSVQGGTVLTGYVERVASAAFSSRGPVARGYAALVVEDVVPDPSVAKSLLRRAEVAGQEDIVLGVLYRAGLVGAHLETYSRLAERTGDPWFQALAAHERALALFRGGDVSRAEGVLTRALTACSESRVFYRCGLLELELSKLYTWTHRLDAARTHALAGLRLARTGNEWVQEGLLLSRLGETARFQEVFPLARAYLRESLLRNPDDCGSQNYVHEILASIALSELDPVTGEREMALAPTCGVPVSLHGAFVLADLVRHGARPQTEARFQESLAELRARTDLDVADRALLDHIEGRVVIERTRDLGRALLLRSVEATEGLPGAFVSGHKARTFSLAVLAIDAVRSEEPTRALEFMGRQVGLPVPEQCVLAVTMDDERVALAARGPDGRAVGWLRTLTTRTPRAEGLVPEGLSRALEGCEQVQVLAPPPLQGMPRLLPERIAWSYRLSPVRALPPLGRGRSVVVSSVQAPASLGLAPLASWRGSGPAPDVALKGAEATPGRVLTEIRDAGLIEFHVHGLEGVEHPDASVLVLSPAPDGRYLLSAEDIRGQRLSGAPLVVLGACHASRGASMPHATWSLPSAFLASGASVVLASASLVQDAEAPAFFAAVVGRIRAGAPPALALREERMRWLTASSGSWVRDVLLFE
ncbi:CHAT domain-containing protein [Myxococcus sp. K15C18031901]|uniref:CHAT domain-containing protein n=1 Tax=Myxococcus dinghuensis TaxID=2906761 RepID=UPI0020A7B7A7|nr:CHAT domain-containing protein [Myxococcus dinghuensis]MCP3104600.1 CHAT domain-containing protein [Myxococcus dinghuensis]